MWGGGVPLPTGGGVWAGGCAPSPEIFLILALRMVGFGAFWGVFFKVELFVLHAKNSVLRLTKLAIAPFSRYSLSNSTVTLTSRSPEMTWFDRAHKTFY